MLGDTAVAVHPDDERYAPPGRHARSSCRSPARHDPDRRRRARRPGLRHRRGQGDARRTTRTTSRSAGGTALPSHDDHGRARRDHRARPVPGARPVRGAPAVVAALRAEGRIVAEKRPYVHSVGHCSRCKTVVEPRLSLQWFVNVAPLAKAAGDAVRDGRIAIHPPELAKRYFDWVDNMHDWCISRQLWWGHRIPVWYGPDGEVVCVGPDEDAPAEGWTSRTPTCSTPGSPPGCGRSPPSAGRTTTPELARFYPTSVLVTGYDILFFWVARMMMFGLYAMDGEPPFQRRGPARHGPRPVRQEDVEVVRQRRRPARLDRALRRRRHPLHAAARRQPRRRRRGQRGVGRRLAQLLQQDLERHPLRADERRDRRAPRCPTRRPDGRRPLDPLPARRRSSRRSTRPSSEFEFAKASEPLYHFAWDEVCDWYLELAKIQLGDGQPSTPRLVLGHVLDALLRLLHPLVPFVTEELWRALTGGESIVVAPWPTADAACADPAAEAEIAALQALVTEVRRFRSDQGLKPGQQVAARLVAGRHGSRAPRGGHPLAAPAHRAV